MRVGVLGGGSFGTALGRLLTGHGHAVAMWVHNPEVASAIAAARENRVYLPGVNLPDGLLVTPNMAEVVAGADLLVAVSPSHVMREVVVRARAHLTGLPYVVSAAKGVEESSLKRMSEVVLDVFGQEYKDRIAVLSGPSFAREVAAGLPTAVTVAAPRLEAVETVQAVFQGPTFRVYSSMDTIGVELGGAVKNVIAIAAGVSDGLGLGSSSRAALITRGVAEVARLVSQLGGDPRTVSGLSGVGDMVLTCTGDLSRNRTVGMRLARGEGLRDILAGMTMVAEGVRNSVSVGALANREGVEMPIAEQVRLMLHGDKPPRQVVSTLMGREAKPEFWS